MAYNDLPAFMAAMRENPTLPGQMFINHGFNAVHATEIGQHLDDIAHLQLALIRDTANNETSEDHLARLGRFMRGSPNWVNPRQINQKSLMFTALKHFKKSDVALILKAARKWGNDHPNDPPLGLLSAARDFLTQDMGMPQQPWHVPVRPIVGSPPNDISLEDFAAYFRNLKTAHRDWAEAMMIDILSYGLEILNIFKFTCPEVLNQKWMRIFRGRGPGEGLAGGLGLPLSERFGRPLTYSLMYYVDEARPNRNSQYDPFDATHALIEAGARTNYTDTILVLQPSLYSTIGEFWPGHFYKCTPAMMLLVGLFQKQLRPGVTPDAFANSIRETLLKIIDAGCDINYRTDRYFSALKFAVAQTIWGEIFEPWEEFGLNVVQILLEAGANIDIPFSDGISNALLGCAVYIWALYHTRGITRSNVDKTFMTMLSSNPTEARLEATTRQRITQNRTGRDLQMRGNAYDFWRVHNGPLAARTWESGRIAARIRPRREIRSDTEEL